jgi:hypothetical protein
MTKAGEELIELAQREFPDLTAAERAALIAAADGSIARLENVTESGAGHRHFSDRCARHPIRAILLRWICAEFAACRRVDPRGIRIEFAQIIGKLDFAHMEIRFPIVLRSCCIAAGIDLTESRTRLLSLDGCYAGLILAHGLKAEGSVFMRGGFRALGPVILQGAVIKGDLEFSGGHFINRGEVAIAADHLQVQGDLMLDVGFVAYGEVRLLGASVGADFDCSGGKLLNRNREALAADGIRVGGTAFLGDGLTTNGLINLRGGRFGADLIVHGAQFAIDSQNGLLAENVKVEGRFDWRSIGHGPATRLTLTHASVGQLIDDEGSWPATGHLQIDGLVYGAIAPIEPENGTRLRWIARERPFSPQPYQQLAEVLKRAGLDDEARRAAIAREEARRIYGDLNRFERLLNWLHGVTTGHGHEFYRVLYFPVFLILTGWLLFAIAADEGLMFPAKEAAYNQYLQTGKLPETYSEFDPLVYTLDVFLPLTDFHQDDYWRPRLYDTCEIAGHRFRCGVWLHRFVGLEAVAGWVFSILGIAGLFDRGE